MGEVTKLLFMFVALVALLVALGFSIVSTTTSYWYEYERVESTTGLRTTFRYGLWIECEDGICQELNVTGSDEDKVRAARGFTIMSNFLLLPLVIVGTYVVTTDHTKDKVIVAILLFVQAILQIIGTAAYTGYIEDQSHFDEDNWNWSFEMAWTSAFLSIFGGVCFFIVGTLLTSLNQVRYKHRA